MDKSEKVKSLVVPTTKSGAQIMQILREAIAHARHNEVTSVFICMVPSNMADSPFMKVAVPVNAVDIDVLLECVEDGHEVVWELGAEV